MTGCSETRNDGDREKFSPAELKVLDQAVIDAEELVANHFKLSASQMKRLGYDIKTGAELTGHEIVENHFAQIVRYRARPRDAVLESDADDLYRICIQDHAVLRALSGNSDLTLYPFLLYVLCHELVHVIRFRRFMEYFNAPEDKRQADEIIVHRITYDILKDVHIKGMKAVLDFFSKWRDSDLL